MIWAVTINQGIEPTTETYEVDAETFPDALEKGKEYYKRDFPEARMTELKFMVVQGNDKEK